MLVADHAKDALDLRNLSLPEIPTVLAIEVEDYVDSMGNDALKVYVIVPDDTDFDQIPAEFTFQIKEAVHDSLLSKGIGCFPFVHFRTVSERQLDMTEEPEE